MRAYAPLLAERDISPAAFTRGLDAINESLLPSPTFRLCRSAVHANGLLMSAFLLTATDARPGLALIAAAADASKTIQGATERSAAVAAALESANSTVFRPAGLSAS